MKAPDFSGFAEQYARSRPRYPPALYARLASYLDRYELVWDCATGSGQAAIGPVEHFERMIATDVSPAQLRHAVRHSRIAYTAARSERPPLSDSSVDLVTVAAALHWFQLDDFYTEVRRVIRAGNVLAAWTYHVCHVEPPSTGSSSDSIAMS